MSKKKPVKNKKKAMKLNKDVDINDIDAMLEDMKYLALDNNIVENHKEETVKVEEEINDKLETETQTVTEEMTETIEENDKVEVVFDSEETPVLEETEEKVEEFLFDEASERVSFGDMVEEEKEEEVKEETKENKPKRKSYQEMFGHTWMGYGYSE